MKKIALALLLAFTLLPAASFAQVVIRIGPPPPVVERIAGYHRYEGDHYAWTPGRWERPPHPGARWEAHRWEHRHGQWVLVEGRWR
jgi:hypothetical protein